MHAFGAAAGTAINLGADAVEYDDSSIRLG
jgi:hypothetical protein